MVLWRGALQRVSKNGVELYSFLQSDENLCQSTVESFGDEWEAFDQFSEEEISKIGKDYFSVLPNGVLNRDISVLDVGCGSGRWSQFVAPLVKEVIAVDPSDAAFVARENTKSLGNVTVLKASASQLPFESESFDLVFSLGVLHHIPDTRAAFAKCASLVKPDGWMLVYLYYALDNRGFLFRSLFHASNLVRKIIYRLPKILKKWICDGIAVFIYWPAANIAKVVEKTWGRNAAERLPLNYYRHTSFFIMRNDALDRFGTPLEQRFTRKEIEQMFHENGFQSPVFSNNQPFWVAASQKKNR